MELVIDTNRIIAALVKDSYVRKIILSRKYSLYTVEFAINEVKKYKPLIKRKSKISEKEFNFLMEHLLSKIAVLSDREISRKSIDKALGIMKEIDADDVPLIALSLELGGIAIWSDDNHFKQQKKIKILKTKDLAKRI